MSRIITTSFSGVLILLMLLAFTMPAMAQTDTVIHFAGRLTDSAGNAMPTASIMAEIYADTFKPVTGTISAGNEVWSDTFNDVVVSGDGTFSIMLGSGVALNLTPGEAYYLVLYVDWAATYGAPDRIFGDDAPAGDVVIVNSGGLQTGDAVLGSTDTLTVGGTASGGVLTLDEFGGTGGSLILTDSTNGNIEMTMGYISSVDTGAGNFLMGPDMLLVQGSAANTTVTGDSMTLGFGTTTGASLNVYASSTTGGDITINGGATSGGGTMTIGAGTASGGGSLTIAGAANDIASAGTLIIDGDSDSSPITFSDGDLMMGSFGNPADVTIDGYVGIATDAAGFPGLAVSHLGANDALSVTGSTTFDGSVEIVTTASSNALVTNGTVEVTGGAVIAPMMSTELMNVGASGSPGNFMLFDGTDTDMNIWANGAAAGAGIAMKRVIGVPIVTAEIMLQTQGAFNGNLTFADTFNPTPITLTQLAQIGNGGGSREIVVDISGGVGQFTSIQAAITYALSLNPVPSATDPVVVFVKPGYYVIGATVELEPYVHIIGRCPESTVIASSAANAFSRSTSSGAGETVLANLKFVQTANTCLYTEEGPVTVFNCNFEFNSGSAAAISVVGNELYVLNTNIDVNGAAGEGIAVTSSGVAEISDSSIYGNASSGALLDVVNANIMVQNSIFDTPSSAAAITCSTAGEIDVANCTITGNSSSALVYLATNGTFTARHSEIQNYNGTGGDAVYSTYASNDPNVPNASMFSCLLEVAIGNQLTAAAANTYYLAPMCAFIGGTGKTDANSEVVEQTTAPNREVVVDQYGAYPGSFITIEEAVDYVTNTMTPSAATGSRVAIIVKPGNYAEAVTLTLPPFVDLLGTSPDSTVVTSSASPAIERLAADGVGECTIANLSVICSGGSVLETNTSLLTVFNCLFETTFAGTAYAVYATAGTADVNVFDAQLMASGAGTYVIRGDTGAKIRVMRSNIYSDTNAFNSVWADGAATEIEIQNTNIESQSVSYAALRASTGSIHTKHSQVIGSNNTATEGIVKLETNGIYIGEYCDLQNLGAGPLFYSSYTSGDPATPNAALSYCTQYVNIGTHFTTGAANDTYYVAERSIIKNSANLTDANSVVDFGPDSSTVFSSKISTSIVDPINEALYVENSNASGNVAVFKGAAAEPTLTVTSNGTVEVGTSITPAQLITQGTLEVHGNAIIASAANSVLPALTTQGTLEVLGNATVSAINSPKPALFVGNTAGVNPGLTVNGGTSLLSASNSLPALYVTYDYNDPGAINTHMYGGAFVDSLTVNDLYITTNLVTPWQNTFIVGPGGDFYDLDELSAASGYPGSFANCLIILTPGVHTPTGIFNVPDFATVKGMDRYLSVISASNTAAPIVSLGNGSTLRNLTVMNTAGTGVAYAVDISTYGEIFNCDLMSDNSTSAMTLDINATIGAKISSSVISAANGIMGIMVNTDDLVLKDTKVVSNELAFEVNLSVTTAAVIKVVDCTLITTGASNRLINHRKGKLQIEGSELMIANGSNTYPPIFVDPESNVYSEVVMGTTMLSAGNATIPCVFDGAGPRTPMPRIHLWSTVTNIGQWANPVYIDTGLANNMPAAFTSFEGAGPTIPWINGMQTTAGSNFVQIALSGGGQFDQTGSENGGNWTIIDVGGTGMNTVSSITYNDEMTVSITFSTTPTSAGNITFKANSAAFVGGTSDSNTATIYVTN